MGAGVPMRFSRRVRLAGAALAALLVLGACSAGNAVRDEGAVSVRDLLRQRVAAAGAPAAAPAPLPSREVLAARTDPLLALDIPSRGARATVTPAARNRGTVTWLSADGITVTTRDGLLIASRGLGYDLMSADVSGTLAALRSGGGAHARVHYALADSNARLARRYDCVTRPLGAEPVEIVGRVSAARLWEESCALESASPDDAAAAGEGRFVNRYWIGAGGAVLRSRQHLTPQIGAIETLLLTD